MSDPKVTAAHLRRVAAVYCRQSTLVQVERNRESTLRQYDLVSRAGALGWPRSAVRVIDADLGVSGPGLAVRAGFTELTEQIALGQVGVVLALEVSRLARSSAEWYRLLDLCGITDTLIADETSVYHPGMFDDRLILGLKGTMAESELQVLRARMLGGLRNKAARGELRIALPAGLVRGEEPGQVLLHPDEAVRGAITAVFDRFAASGSARQTWLWLRENRLKLPSLRGGQLAWVTAAYPAVHKILAHPAYAGAYVYGRTRAERYIDASGTPAGKRRAVPRPADWQVLITGHHPGYIDWDTYLANTARLAANMAPVRGADGTGATREGCALLQGLAVCGTCGRRPGVFYRGTAKSAPGYQCNGGVLVGGGQGRRCTRVSGVRVDPAVAGHVLEVLTPLALQAALDAADQIEAGHDAALDQWRRQAEQARYAATRAERRYRAVDPENRLVARGLEAEWEASLQAVRDAEAELERRQAARPVRLSADERAGILAIATDMPALWDAPSTTDRDRKELLHALLDDVVVTADDTSRTARLVLHWKGGLISELTADLPRPKPPYRTSEDTVSLIGRLAAHYDDSMITKVLNQQKRRTATGMSFTPANVATVRKRHGIPPCQGGNAPDPDGEVMSVHQAAAELGITASTLYRWLNDGIVPGEQITPGAPWRIRLTSSIRNLVADDAPAGWVPVQVATAALGVSRQTVLQRVKRGELRAVHIRTGRRKGLRIELPPPRMPLLTPRQHSRSSVMSDRLGPRRHLPGRQVPGQDRERTSRHGDAEKPCHQPAPAGRPREHRRRQPPPCPRPPANAHATSIRVNATLPGPWRLPGVLENIIWLELRRRGYEVTVGKVGTTEVDFVAQRQEDTIYVQVATTIAASAETRRREYASLEAIADNYPKYVLSLDPLAGDKSGGIHHLRIPDFLLLDSY